jgi:hypothetical protein
MRFAVLNTLQLGIFTVFVREQVALQEAQYDDELTPVGRKQRHFGIAVRGEAQGLWKSSPYVRFLMHANCT